jgi:Cu(I)/Ag(I) efflux system membrane fusion protein
MEMIMFKKSQLIGLMFAGALVFAACDSKTETAADNRSDAAGDRVEKNEDMREDINSAWEQYLEVKDALVASQPNDVQREANELVDEIKEVDKWDATSDKKQQWVAFAPKFTQAAQNVAATGDIAQQRVAFEQLSMVMEEGLKTFGLHRKTAYKQHCPMAFNNKGAAWFSDDKTIENPYEPSMKSCGSVTAEMAF